MVSSNKRYQTIIKLSEEELRKIKNEDGDENFISNRGNERKGVKPIHSEVKSLGEKGVVGGVEINYKEIAKQNDKDQDVWDKRSEEINKMASNEVHQDAVELESFIHSVKTGAFGKRKKRRRSMGQVDLGKAASDEGGADMTYVEKLRNLRQDKTGFTRGGGDLLM